MVIVGRPMNSNDPQRCPFDKFLIGYHICMKNLMYIFINNFQISYDPYQISSSINVKYKKSACLECTHAGTSSNIGHAC